MSTAEDLLLIATNPRTGKAMIGAPQVDPALGGAFLIDLAAAGRLAVEGKGRSTRVVVVDTSRVDDPVLERAFTRVRTKGRQTPRTAVTTMGRQSRKFLYAAMVENGILRRRRATVLGIVPVTRHDIVDPAKRDDLRVRIRASLVHGQPSDAQTAPLIALLAAGDLTRIIVDRPERKVAKARAKLIAEGDWASEGVRKAITSAQTAMTAAIAAGAAAAAAGSS